MPLPAAVVMIDESSLIVAADKSGLDQFGDGPAEVGLARAAHPLADFGLDQDFDCGMVVGQAASAFKLVTDPPGECLPFGISPTHRGKRIAQPVAQQCRGSITHDERPGAAIGSCHLGDEAEDHESITRPRAGACQPVEQGRHSAGFAALVVLDWC